MNTPTVYLLQYTYYLDNKASPTEIRGVYSTKEKALTFAWKQLWELTTHNIDPQGRIDQDDSSLTLRLPTHKETRLWVAMPYMVE